MSRSANHFFTGAGSGPANYIEDVFSTFLYTGTDGAQTITNGIDLSTNGGLVWGKSRSGTQNHRLYDTARGSSFSLISNATSAQSNQGTNACAFNTNGFSLSAASGIVGSSGFGGPNYVSWTFRKQKKFFDIVTYTGNSTARTIAHNLGSVPGCIIVKKTNSTGQWCVYHRGLTSAAYTIFLNLTDTQTSDTAVWNSTAPTSSVFSLGTSTGVNNSGDTYVAYIFAHDAGGFGLTGNDNVISCGSLTTDGSGNFSVNLGYEPQWVLAKATNATDDWILWDTMRGWPARENTNLNYVTSRYLSPNTSTAEAGFGGPYVTNTGFGGVLVSSITYIYIAIRRGPMKVPTVGTSVFTPATRSATGAVATVTGVGFPPDLYFSQPRQSNRNPVLTDRLRGATKSLSSRGTYAEQTETGSVTAFDQDGVTLGANNADFFNGVNDTGFTFANWNFRRAPGFFDIVCWTGDSTNPRSISHNLTVAPTLIITKKRNSTSNWITGFDFASTTYKYFFLEETVAANSDTYASSPVYGGNPTASVFIVGNQGNMNISGDTYVSYLFATCAGVSKVGSYTGTATTKQVDCGFTAGARFVLIKRTDSTGDWYVWDTARGIIAGNDPYLLMNSTAAEVTNTDYIDSYSPGFELSSTAPAAINANGGTYIFLAIA